MASAVTLRGFRRRFVRFVPQQATAGLSTLAATHRLRVWHELVASSGRPPQLAVPTAAASPLDDDDGDGDNLIVDEAAALQRTGAQLAGWALEQHYGDDCLLNDGSLSSTANGGSFFRDALVLPAGSGAPLTAARLAALAHAPPDVLLDKDRISADIDALIVVDSNQKQGPATRHPSDADAAAIASLAESLAAGRHPLLRIAVSRSDAARLFAYSPLKLAAIAQLDPDAQVSIIKCGEFIDLCNTPLLARNSAAVRAVRIPGTGAAQWRSGVGPQALARVNGIAFSSRAKVVAYEQLCEETRLRDHRIIGQKQSLFHFSTLSPGAPFFLPHGTRIVQRLLDFLRAEYRIRGFDEVVTPLVFDRALWEKSGHWQNYHQDMVAVSDCQSENSHPISNIQSQGDGSDQHLHSSDQQQVQQDQQPEQPQEQQEQQKDQPKELQSQQQALKPMNCPGHCILFASTARSYRDLPMRLAEFSPLHRNEASGALSGLTRVRKFHQDDGHVFCTPEQVGDEIRAALDFIESTYTKFKFPSYEMALSTRPASGFVGELEQWDAAEAALRDALDGTGRPWTIKHGDGAFYGPKIDIAVRDSVGRQHQTATIQLDFQLPQRFGLRYQAADGALATPVVIHRAVLGSIERTLAILTEHYSGKWPFWLSPRHAVVVPVRPDLHAYARQVHRELIRGPGATTSTSTAIPAPWFYIDVDTTDNFLSKRIRTAQNAQYNYILVVGDRERDAGTVSLRTRSGDQLGAKSIADIHALFLSDMAEFR